MSTKRDMDLELVKRHALELGEHFDSVHIFVTQHESGELDGTVNIQFGMGNWFARYGQVKTWIVKADEDSKVDIRKDRE